MLQIIPQSRWILIIDPLFGADIFLRSRPQSDGVRIIVLDGIGHLLQVLILHGGILNTERGNVGIIAICRICKEEFCLLIRIRIKECIRIEIDQFDHSLGMLAVLAHNGISSIGIRDGIQNILSSLWKLIGIKNCFRTILLDNICPRVVAPPLLEYLHADGTINDAVVHGSHIVSSKVGINQAILIPLGKGSQCLLHLRLNRAGLHGPVLLGNPDIGLGSPGKSQGFEGVQRLIGSQPPSAVGILEGGHNIDQIVYGFRRFQVLLLHPVAAQPHIVRVTTPAVMHLGHAVHFPVDVPCIKGVGILLCNRFYQVGGILLKIGSHIQKQIRIHKLLELAQGGCSKGVRNRLGNDSHVELGVIGIAVIGVPLCLHIHIEPLLILAGPPVILGTLPVGIRLAAPHVGNGQGNGFL